MTVIQLPLRLIPKRVCTDSMRPITLSEALCRPLGIGYDDYPSLLREYIHPRESQARTPDLGISLAGLEHADIFGAINFGIIEKPCCLIQGITSPRNGTSLRKFLQGGGILDPTILAIDIANISAVLATMNVQFPDVQFSVADASNLASFPDRSIQVLVQDHLLNCTPHANHESIIREAARLLDPQGFLILNFSVHASAATTPVWTHSEFEKLFGFTLNDRAYCLKDLIENPCTREKYKSVLPGTMVTLDLSRSIVITPPTGNFEFYFTRSELEARLARHGLRFVFATSESGIDSHGFSCLRYRTVVQHCG